MQTHTNRNTIPYAPRDTKRYPETDGKPMAATDLHRDLLIWTIQALETHYAENPDVYVSGDIMMYDIEGPHRTAISPDVLVTFGIGQKQRRTYKVWEEGKPPDFVMEFSSEGTYQNDLSNKMDHYARMGIQDYFLYDAEGLYLPQRLMGVTSVNGRYEPIPVDADGGIYSEALDLVFRLQAEHFGIYDPVGGEWLQTAAEAAETRARQEASRAENAEARAENAEAEVAQLREELDRLRQRT